MEKRRTLHHWLLAAGMTAALFAALAAVSSFRFENSDDGLILRTFMGFEGGAPASFGLYTHTLLAWALWGLGTLAPAVPWFSLIQLGLCALGCVVAGKCFLQLAAGYTRPRVAGGLVAVLYLGVFAAFACCRLNYTTTAALVGAAAVLQGMASPLSGKGAARGLALSLLLMAAAYCLRAQGALPAVAYLGLTLAWRFAQSPKAAPEARATRRAAMWGLAALAIVVGALYAVRAVELAARGLTPDIAWHAARTALMDYTRFEAAPQAAMQSAAGLPAPLVTMATHWYFMDSAVTTDALRAMAAAYPRGGAGLLAAWRDYLTGDARTLWVTLLPVLLFALCLTARRGGPRLARTAAGLGLLGAALILSYLMLAGRIPPRAADAVLLPCAAFLCGLLLRLRVTPLAGAPARRGAAALLCALALATGAFSLRLTYHAVTRAQDVQSMERSRLFTQIGLAHPGWYVLRSPNLYRDTSLAPYTAEGIPPNTAIWGDWTCRTPSWYAQMALLGFDGRNFSAADWLRHNIVLVTVDANELADMCAYLGDALGGPVQAVEAGRNGELPYYRFVMAGEAP